MFHLTLTIKCLRSPYLVFLRLAMAVVCRPRNMGLKLAHGMPITPRRFSTLHHHTFLLTCAYIVLLTTFSILITQLHSLLHMFISLSLVMSFWMHFTSFRAPVTLQKTHTTTLCPISSSLWCTDLVSFQPFTRICLMVQLHFRSHLLNMYATQINSLQYSVFFLSVVLCNS